MTTSSPSAAQGEAGLAFSSARGRWVLAATVLGSGIAFLDSTVVNVALPHIGEDLDTGVGGLQWVLNGYLLAVSSLILLGGSLGDRCGRKRIFQIGIGVFALGSLLVYFVVLPMLVRFSLGMQQVGGDETAQIQLLPKVGEYLSLMMSLIFAFGVAALAVIGALSRTLGNRFTAVLGVVGGAGTGQSGLIRSIIGLQTPAAGEIEGVR